MTAVIPAKAGIQYSRGRSGIRRGRGVLDRPVKPGDDAGVWGLRPAYPDNLPRIGVRGGKISVNGLYRHGFLLAPALAELTLAYVERGQIDNEVMQCA